MKRLALKTEHLTELTADELAQAAGAGAGAYSGAVDCIVSFDRCLTIAACTALCGPTA